MSEQENQKTGFSDEYVKELRQENASWRTKVRDLESKLQLGEVKTELLKHGVDVNPKWVELQEGQDISEAVTVFLDNYPQFRIDDNKETYTEPKPKPMRTGASDTNTRGPKPRSGSYGGRGLTEIRKDPKARADLRNRYRQLLAQQSNHTYDGEE